jgi:sigma-E factor negative regulatory protein RseC
LDRQESSNMNNFVPMIDHEGIVEHIEGNRAHVRIGSVSACAACHAKGVCGASDQEVKYLDVPTGGADYHPGDLVMVQVARGLGLKAVAMGYVYPMLLLVAVLVILISIGMGELKAAGLALASLLPYYLAIYLLRGRIEHTFTFSMRKLNSVQ